MQENHQLPDYFIFKTPHHFSFIGSKKKNETAPESQLAAAPWSGGFLSGSKRRPAGRPEPLWRPVCEEEEKAHASSSEDSKPSVLKRSQGDKSPPSPRTLQAIQAAMNNSSDEEKADWDKRGGGLSPRTQLAIQKALAEDDTAEHGTLIDSSSTKVQANIDRPVPQVVISSSEEEPEPQDVNSLLSEKNDFKVNLTGQRLDVKDSVLNSSSEDEIEELIGQRNKALHFAALQNPQTRLEEETEKGQVSDAEQRLITKNGVQPQGAAASNQNSLSINNSTQILGNPLSVETELHPVLSEQRSDKTPEAPEERSGERSEESESEGTVSLRSHSFTVS